MFSDTHFHFRTTVEERGLDGAEILSGLAEKSVPFALDIGTHCDDLPPRQKLVAECLQQLSAENKSKVKSLFYFSGGIWPAPEAIADRFAQVAELEKQIVAAQNSADEFNRKIVAIGECGIDHHWNPAGVDGRSADDFDEKMFRGEKEMFSLQIDLARKLDLPVIVHSRDGFADTLDCIKDCGYDNGIIHCYSYGIPEAKTFLDRGWYIAFGGGVTYTKKSKLDDMTALLRYVPDDRIIMETDAPYLAPVPYRGQTNTPLLVEHVYHFVANARGVTSEQLAATVNTNIARLFRI